MMWNSSSVPVGLERWVFSQGRWGDDNFIEASNANVQ